MTGMVVRREDLTESDDTPESWHCIDCGVNTAPGFPTRSQLHAGIDGGVLSLFTPDQEIYTVHAKVWRKAGNPSGCLCIGCLEGRLGRPLRPKDFVPNDGFDSLPASARLRQRRGSGESSDFRAVPSVAYLIQHKAAIGVWARI